MLSEVHSTNYIHHWMNQFIVIVRDIPNEFISDMSLVLLNAAAKAFGKCSDLNDYVHKLFKMHKKQKKIKKPPCFIRIDKAHLIKNVVSCVPLKNKPKRLRDFYVYSVCLLMNATTLKEAEDILYSTLVVCLAKTEGRSIIFIY